MTQLITAELEPKKPGHFTDRDFCLLRSTPGSVAGFGF